MDCLTEYQRELFLILEEFFLLLTGKNAKDFSSPKDFIQNMKKMGNKLSKSKNILNNNTFQYLEENVRSLYAEKGADAFKAAKAANGLKLNLGGGSSFLETHLNAVKKSLLYADTILIPDPIMPWFEVEREEKFIYVGLLQAAFFLLYLKEFVFEDFELPPIVVFPSWEKTLENNDSVTISGTQSLITDICSCYLDTGIKEFNELIDYVERSPQTFLEKVEIANLFVAPAGGTIGEPLHIALEKYKTYLKVWKKDKWNKTIQNNPDAIVVLNAICERLQPQYHLIENSTEFRSHPLLCVEAQAHYYSLVANVSNKRLEKIGAINLQTSGIIKALTSKRIDWLSKISEENLLNLRNSCYAKAA